MLSVISSPVCWGGLIAFIMGMYAIDAISALQYTQDEQRMQEAEEYRVQRFA